MLNNVLGTPAVPPFYVWANEDCQNKAEDFQEAKRIRKALLDEDSADDVHIVDADAVEVVDGEIEADEAERFALQPVVSRPESTAQEPNKDVGIKHALRCWTASRSTTQSAGARRGARQ